MSLISSAIRNGLTKLLPLFTKPKHVLRKRLEVPRNIFRHYLDPYFDYCPTSKMKTLSKKVSEFQLLTIFAKSLPNGFLSLFWIRLFYQILQKKLGLSYSFKRNYFWEPLRGVVCFEKLFQTKYSRMEQVKFLTNSLWKIWYNAD